jgi:hypothetical protein
MATKKRSKTTKAKARVKAATTKARKKVARKIAPKRKRPKPKTLAQKMTDSVRIAFDNLTK